jgi:YHS domain-containing protein
MMEVKMNMVKDPVCGMNVDEKTGTLRSEYKGKTYYFCSQSCKEVFEKNPLRFADEDFDCEEDDCCCC